MELLNLFGLTLGPLGLCFTGITNVLTLVSSTPHRDASSRIFMAPFMADQRDDSQMLTSDKKFQLQARIRYE